MPIASIAHGNSSANELLSMERIIGGKYLSSGIVLYQPALQLELVNLKMAMADVLRQMPQEIFIKFE